MARRPHEHEHRHGHGHAEEPEPRSLTKPSALGGPVFAQPEPTADPRHFAVRHVSDREAYREIDALNREHRLAPMPFPPPRGGVEPRLTLADLLDGDQETIDAIASGRPTRLPHRRRYRQHARTGDAEPRRRQDDRRLRRRRPQRRAALLPPSRRRRLQLRRGCLLLRPVLRALSRLSRADHRAGRQPRRDGGARGRREDAYRLPRNFCAGALRRHAARQEGCRAPRRSSPAFSSPSRPPFSAMLALYSQHARGSGRDRRRPHRRVSSSTSSRQRFSASTMKNSRARSSSPTIIPCTSPTPCTAAAPKWASRSTRSATRSGSGRTRCSPATPTTTSASPAATGRCRIPYLIAGNGGHGLARLSRRGKVLAHARRRPRRGRWRRRDRPRELRRSGLRLSARHRLGRDPPHRIPPRERRPLRQDARRSRHRRPRLAHARLTQWA